jgi:hypothetical protein
VVYNPKFLNIVKDFFVTPFEDGYEIELSPLSPWDNGLADGLDDEQAAEQRNAAFTAALSKYEELKQQAKEELKKEIVELLEGKSVSQSFE